MSQKTDEFKEFVKTHPGLKNVVYKEKKTWQSLFEEWSLFGDTDLWDKYKDENIKTDEVIEEAPKVKESSKSSLPISKEVSQLGDMLKSCVNYVKKINPDNVTKTVTNIQKLMALVAGIGAANTANAAQKDRMTGDPLFDRRFDEWY